MFLILSSFAPLFFHSNGFHNDKQIQITFHFKTTIIYINASVLDEIEGPHQNVLTQQRGAEDLNLSCAEGLKCDRFGTNLFARTIQTRTILKYS